MKIIKYPLLATLALIISIAGSFVVSHNAAAYSGSGYFSGRTGNWNGGYGGDVFSSSIPNSSSKSTFIRTIKARLASGDVRTRTGAAFIINLMVGAGTGSGSFAKTRNPSSAMKAEWERRINDPNITIQRVFADPNSYGDISFWDSSIADDFFVNNYNPSARQMLIFKYKGRATFRVEVRCGNPVGRFQLPEPSKNWAVSPNTTINKDSMKPNNTVRWKHTIKKSGADDTTEVLTWQIRQFKLNPGESKNDKIGTAVLDNTISKGKSNGQILYREPTYDANESDVGKRICQYIRVKPYAVVNDKVRNSWRKSSVQCVKVTNTPSGDFMPDTDVRPDVAEPNTGITYEWEGSVTDGTIPASDWRDGKREPQTKPSDVTFKIARYVYPAGVGTTYSGGESRSEFSCPTGSTDCNVNFRVDHAKKKPNGVKKFTGTETIPSLAVGSRICYVASVYLPPETKDATYDYGHWERIPPVRDKDGKIITPARRVWRPDVRHFNRYDDSTRKWRKSAEACLLIAKRPRVQVHSGDLIAGGDITTGTSTYGDGKTYGSWGEYAVLSGGSNDFFGSGAPFTNGSSSGKPSWSSLTFANTTSTYGEFRLIPESPAIAQYYHAQLSSATPGWSGSSLSGKSGLYKAGGNVSLSGNSNVTGSVILYAEGTVTIKGDISYKDGPYGTTSKLPQVIIIAKHIDITHDVSRVDAWLITTDNPSDPTTAAEGDDSINTCSDAPARLSYSDCANQLRINGPIITSDLQLFRTFGAKNEADKGEPAEIFNLRPDAYLWAYGVLSQSNSVAQTVDVVELPPRF